MTAREGAGAPGSALPAAAAKRPHWLMWVAIATIVAMSVAWGIDYALVSKPVAERLEKDSRNATFILSGHYRYFVDPNTLVLNLEGDTRTAAPVDILRGTFQAAGELHKRGRRFDSVILAREGKTIFLMSGEDFAELGRAFEAHENPIYLSRTFPEKLRRSDGSAAFGTWSGGLLGVLGKQMEDVNDMAAQWAMPVEASEQP